nr:YlxR family protein [Desulfoplanes formicivorans]
MCVICRQRFPKSEIIRYTCPQNDKQELCPDPTGKRSGRGFYVCTSSECMKKFKKFRGWQKKCRGEHYDN